MKYFIHYVYIDLVLSVVWMSMLLVKPLSKVKTCSILKSYRVIRLYIIICVVQNKHKFWIESKLNFNFKVV